MTLVQGIGAACIIGGAMIGELIKKKTSDKVNVTTPPNGRGNKEDAPGYDQIEKVTAYEQGQNHSQKNSPI